MNRCLPNNHGNHKTSFVSLGKLDLRLASILSSTYQALHTLLIALVCVVLAFWFLGLKTHQSSFDFARSLIPDTARELFWGSLGWEPDSHGLYGDLIPEYDLVLLKPAVAYSQVKSISHLSDLIPVSKVDPLALDKNLMGSLESQRVIANYFENKYSLDRAKIEEYVSNAVLIAREVHIDPVLLLSVISIESNFNPLAKSKAGAEGLMQVMTRVHEDKYSHYGGPADAVKPEVNMRIGAYILKNLIAKTGSLQEGLKYYVGAANMASDGGYADKVLAERDRLIQLCKSASSQQFTMTGQDLRS
jgi:hypothetical protein